MTANPLLGVLFHWMGGLSSASFYVPYRGVRPDFPGTSDRECYVGGRA